MPNVPMESRRLVTLRRGRGVIGLFVRILGGVWLDGEGPDFCRWGPTALGAVKEGLISISIFYKRQ